MPSNQITYQEYWKEVAGLAKQIAQEAKDEGLDESEAYDRLHEVIDGHQWVIYTWANPYVLIHSQNENALFDELGAPQEFSDYSDFMMKTAFWALRADVAAEIQSEGLLDFEEEEQEEVEEEEPGDGAGDYEIDVE